MALVKHSVLIVLVLGVYFISHDNSYDFVTTELEVHKIKHYIAIKLLQYSNSVIKLLQYSNSVI